jgi:hypothetical protein
MEKALVYALRALALYERIRKIGSYFVLLAHIGSLQYLKAALNIARDLRLPKLLASIYEAMLGVYRQEKNYREAVNALEEQHHLLDSVLGSDGQRYCRDR